MICKFVTKQYKGEQQLIVKRSVLCLSGLAEEELVIFADDCLRNKVQEWYA